MNGRARRRWSPRRIARYAVRGLAVVVAALLVLLALVVLGINTPWARRQLVAQVNSALADSFEGTLRLKRVGRVGLGGVDGVDAEVMDRAGRRVLEVQNLEVALDLLPLAWDAVVARPRELRIAIDAIELDNSHVRLIDAGDGVPTLATAFRSRSPGAPSEGTTTLHVAGARIGHVWAHGSLSGTRIDADVAELRGRFGVTETQFELDVSRAELRARALPARIDPLGELAGSLALPLGETPAPLVAQVRFDGEAWGGPIAARAQLRGRSVSARLVLDALGPDQLGRALPGTELGAPVAVRATLSGTLDRPEVSLRTKLGAGRVDAELALDSEARTLRASVRPEKLDLSLLDPALPPSALSATLNARGKYNEAGDLTLDYGVRLADSKLEGSVLPITEGKGDFELRHAAPERPRAWSTRGELTIAEPGAHSVFDFEAHSAGAAPSVRVAGTTTLDRPARLAELVPGLYLRGNLRSDARLDLAAKRLWVNAHARLPELRTATASTQQLELKASAEGPLERPNLALEAEFAGLAVAGRAYRDGSVRVAGTPEQLSIDARARAPQTQASALVTIRPEVAVSDAEVRLGSGDEVLTLSAASLRFPGQRISVKGLRVATPSGWARASLEYGKGIQSLRLQAQDLDLSEVAAPLQVEGPMPRGVVTADVRFDRDPAGASGYVEAGVQDLGYGRFEDAKLALSARLRRGLVMGSLDARWRDSAARVNIDELPLDALTSARSKELTGRVAGQASIDLTNLGPLLELGVVPLETASGHAELAFRVERGRQAPARLEATLETSRLRLVGERDELDRSTAQAARRAAPWSLTGTDVGLSVALDQATRELSVDATLTDAKGKLAILRTDARWPGEAARLPLAAWPSLWQRAETTLDLWLLPRKLSEWPSPVAVNQIDGTASFSLHAVGSYQDPNVRWMARLENFGPPDEAPQKLELNASGDYRPEAGAARVGILAKDRRVAEVQAEWNGDAIGYFATGRGVPVASVRGRLDGFPAAAVPLAASQRLAGHLSGAFEVEQTRGSWGGHVRIDSNDFSVARIAADRLRLQASLREGWLDASLSAAGRALGRVAAEVSGWTPLGNPRREPELRAKLRASDFQLKSLEPLVSGSVSGLEGRLNADLAGELSSKAPKLRGHVAVSRGAAQLPAIGQTLHAIEARLNIDRNRIALNRFEARGLTGKLRGRGSAVLDGLAVRSAEASVDIAERDKIPLTVRGVTLGDAWGRAAVRYRPINERRQRLDVDVARFNLDLPDVSPPGVQSLEPAAHIEVGHETRAGKFVEIPLQPIELEEPGAPTRWVIAVNLGNVEVHKGPGIAIGLKGNLKARIGRRTRLDGRIDLTGGKIDVSGKEFKIERGALTFDRSEVEDGVVTATARWDSPAEYTVYAEYSGTVKEGELNLRSEPPLTQDEILGLVMFGTPGGTFGAQKKDEAATAVGLAGGTVAKGLNRALSEFSSLDLSTRVDTSTGEARPELVLQVTPRVTARVTQAIGEAPPGQSPDRTFLTVDLRLFTRWSLSTQVGDEGGTSLDLIWRHRY